ncbi:MAG TPA: hypothetical protein VKU80_18920 [Planctomycetota bacterium]|nr:hypothetical protein [Planctomycetota bacterium]
MKKLAMALTFLAALPLAVAAQVTKEDLKKLAAAGISDEVILSYIKANGGVAKLSAEDVVELKQAGASEKLLSVALGSSQGPAAAPAPAPAPSASPAYGTEGYALPSSTYVYDSDPYYYTPAVSYAALSIGPLWPYSYCYPRYYNNCYNNCYPRTYGYGTYYTGRYYGGYSRGFAGVSSYRSHR